MLALSMVFGALCIGLFAAGHLPTFWMMAALFGAGGGFVGSQLGPAERLCAPRSIRPRRARTGINWALGVGRLGGIAGPIIGGALLGLGLPPTEVMLFACGPGLVLLPGWLLLGRLRRDQAALSAKRREEHRVACVTAGSMARPTSGFMSSGFSSIFTAMPCGKYWRTRLSTPSR